MGSTDGEDLFDVMPSVNELEPAPMIDVEGAEDSVAGQPGGRAEEAFGFAANMVEAGELLGDGVGKSIAG
jgi:hypothetical protein